MVIEDLKELDLAEPTEVRRYIESDYQPTPRTEYCGWLQKLNGEVIYRVWAYKTTKSKGQQRREVIRSILGNDFLIYRDMYLSYMGGYKIVFKPESSKSENWYGYSYYSYSEEDFGRWYVDKKIGVCVHIINEELLKDTKFKYSGYNGGDILNWMRVYKQYPQVEYLGKLGYPPSKKLLKKAAKDKAFCKYLARENNPGANINALCYAYDHNMSVYEAGRYLMHRNEAGRLFKGNTYLKRSGINKVKACDYVEGKLINPSSYCDYIEACMGLGLDLKDTKNAFPDNFDRMYTLRVNQWDSQRNKKKHSDFKKAAVGYLKYEFEGEKYSVIIPKKIKDLINEENVLQHCVGKMGYDNKMIEGRSFIAFVRKNNHLKEPFVTVEVELPNLRVLQCYGKNDSNPGKEINNFVKNWNKTIKKVI